MRKVLTILTVIALSCQGMAMDQSTAKTRTSPGTLGARPAPPRLALSANLSTPAGNKTLYENEYGVLDLAITNMGDLIAEGVVARVHSGWVEGLTVDSLKIVGNILPHDTVHAGFLLSTTERLARQSVYLPITVSDSAGNMVTSWTSLFLDGRSVAEERSERSPKDQLQEILSKGRNWLLVVGINGYVHWPPLENASTDAQSVRSILIENYGFYPSQVIELYDKEATRANIIKKLEYLARTVRPEDNLMIYYAGHGTFDNLLQRGYWIPVDADIGSSAQYLPNTDLQVFLAAIRSRATLVVSDACFSGTVFREGPSTFPLYQDERYFRQVSKLKARQAIVSGGNEPVMDTGISNQHSVFAYYFLDRLKQNQDKYLTVSTLFERIKIPITNSSQQTPQCKQIHNTGDEGGEFVFVKKR